MEALDPPGSPPPPRKDRRGASVAARLLRPRRALLLVGLVYAGTLAMLPRDGFWVVDNGAKYLQVQAAVRGGGTSVAIEWPGRELDPSLELNPIPFPYSIVQDGEIHYVSPPAFALASALPYRLLGTTGLYLLPLASALALLAGVARLGRELGLGERARAGAVLIGGLATPVWFYGVSFWEHAVAACLALWAIVHGFAHVRAARSGALGTGRLVASGAFAASGIALRTDLYLLLPVLLLVVVAQLPRERRLDGAVRFATGALLALVPVWLLNFATTGAPMGIHGTSVFAYGEGLAGHLSERGRVAWNLFVASHWRPGLSLALALPFLALLATRPSLESRLFRRALPVVALVATASAAVTLWGYRTSPHGALWQVLHANALFAAAPALGLALLRRRGDQPGARERRWVWGLVLAYCGLYALAAPLPSTAGVHWGARFLLLVYPLLALLAAGNLEAWLAGRERGDRAGATALALLLLLGVGAQVWSIELLRRAQDFSVRFNAAVAGRPERVVVSSSWRTGQELARVFDRKQIFFLRDDEDWRALRARLVATGAERVLWIESASAAPTRSEDPSEIVDDGGLGLYAVRITSTPLTQPPPPAAATRPPAGAARPASPRGPASRR